MAFIAILESFFDKNYLIYGSSNTQMSAKESIV